MISTPDLRKRHFHVGRKWLSLGHWKQWDRPNNLDILLNGK